MIHNTTLALICSYLHLLPSLTPVIKDFCVHCFSSDRGSVPFVWSLIRSFVQSKVIDSIATNQISLIIHGCFIQVAAVCPHLPTEIYDLHLMASWELLCGMYNVNWFWSLATLASFPGLLSGRCDLGMRPPCFSPHSQAFSVVGVTWE